MRIGLSSIYAWRPHVEHLAYLNYLLRQAGHETFFLVCDSQLTSCYTRELRQSGKLRECPGCIAGGLRSFVTGPFDTLNATHLSLRQDRAEDMTLSSARTLIRTEDRNDVALPAFKAVHQRLAASVGSAYASALAWIEKQRLDAIVIFNGRMDSTRALLDAARDVGVPVVTVERTWFSDGLLLVPNDGPLDLKQHHRLNAHFRDQFLTDSQATLAAQRMTSRFLGRNSTEWRVYNKNAVSAAWPASREGIKTVILPSSRNEVEGHPDWQTGWLNFGVALDAVLEYLHISSASTILRCHPNWSENIGVRTGELSEIYYSNWAKKRGILSIGSTDKMSSAGLIAEADLVIVNGGSAAYEAGALGKPCITLSPATYSEAGFSANVYSSEMLSNCERVLALSSKRIIELSLRSMYTHNYRHSQFTRFVHAKSPVEFSYYDGADSERIVNIFKTGQLEPDDTEISDAGIGEADICALISQKKWEEIASIPREKQPDVPLHIKRRPMLRWLDSARRILPRGDA